MQADLTEQIAEALHRSADERVQSRFRVAWKDCLPAYRELLLSDARAVEKALKAAGYSIQLDEAQLLVKGQAEVGRLK